MSALAHPQHRIISRPTISRTHHQDDSRENLTSSMVALQPTIRYIYTPRRSLIEDFDQTDSCKNCCGLCLQSLRVLRGCHQVKMWHIAWRTLIVASFMFCPWVLDPWRGMRSLRLKKMNRGEMVRRPKRYHPFTWCFDNCNRRHGWHIHVCFLQRFRLHW